MELSKIMVAVDGSDSSLNAASFAMEVAKKYNSDLHLLNVIQSQLGYAYTSGAFGGVVTPNTINELIQKSRGDAEKWFNKIRQMDPNIRTVADVVVSATSVVSAIIEYAENHNIDLIIVGTRGRSGLKKLLLGSVASGVVTYSSCPVIVVK